jgi:NADH-quinone oxidoreductase subunit L
MRNMGGLKSYMKVTWILMWLATLAIAGFPFLSGFFSKDEILTSVWVRRHGSTLADASWLGIPGSVVLTAVYVMGLAAALMTAIYMTRMMLYTFHGPNRTGEAERKHLAEAPWVMTGPLVVLGVLTVFGGLLNVPNFDLLNLGGLLPTLTLEHWLEPVVGNAMLTVTHGHAAHAAHSTELVLILVAVAIGIGGILYALARLKPQRLVPKAQAPEEHGFGRVLADKYYVDELYDQAVVKPTYTASRGLLWRGVDAGIIDGLVVNGSALAARFAGWLGSQLQSGQTGTYAWVLVLGVIAVLGAFTLR